MKAVGVKTLKAKLSEYLRLVKTGETVLVTERDEVIAEIKPTRRQNVAETDYEEELAFGAELGLISLRSDDSKKWPSLKPLSGSLDVNSQTILDELRRD